MACFTLTFGYQVHGVLILAAETKGEGAFGAKGGGAAKGKGEGAFGAKGGGEGKGEGAFGAKGGGGGDKGKGTGRVPRQVLRQVPLHVQPQARALRPTRATPSSSRPTRATPSSSSTG